MIGQKWRELSEEDKQPYFEEYEAEKASYTEQMKAYRNSPAYKRWLELKQQGEAAPAITHIITNSPPLPFSPHVPAEQSAREAAAQASSAGAGSQSYHEYGPPPPSIIAPSRHSMESRLQMMQQQQQDDEEGEEGREGEGRLWE